MDLTTFGRGPIAMIMTWMSVFLSSLNLNLRYRRQQAI